MASFASDNTAIVAPEIMQALQACNQDHARAYGHDDLTSLCTARFRAVFEHPDLLVFPVFNGSAANCAALASLIRPHQAVVCHHLSHIQNDECGMPEFFTGGKLLGAEGANGKITPQTIAPVVDRARSMGVHHVPPAAISLTQATECGTVYQPDDVRMLGDYARANGLRVHMDGARFANAVAAIGCHPADITWRAGVDVLSFGATKNGAMMAEAIIFFDPHLAEGFGFMRKRFGQLASKQRYLSAQLLALLADDLWLHHARHANQMAQKLVRGLLAITEVSCAVPVQANEVFIHLPRALADHLLACGHVFYDWPWLGDNCWRFVTSFATTQDDVDSLLRDAASWVG